MKRKKMIILSIVLLVVISTLVYGFYYFFYDMNHLQDGELLSVHNSPSNKYTLNVYLLNGGATVSYSIRGEIVDNNSKKEKNIYLKYRQEEADIEWESDDVVIINGIRLDISKNEIYDWRRQ